MEYDKKFLVLGNMNAITYKEIFPYIKDNKLWPGVSFNKTIEFEVPDHYDTSKAIEKDGKKIIKVPAISWWTNLDYPRRHQDIILFREYEGNEDKYPKYDNYDAINVDKVAEIPKDYKGTMGVPISFIGQWNPEQFEIVDANDYRLNNVPKKAHGMIKDSEGTIGSRTVYARILIKRKVSESDSHNEL